MLHPRRSRQRRQGFTLIEIMVVVIVIGVLAALVIPNLFGRSGQAKQAVAKQKIATIDGQISMFQQDHGRFPDTLDELINPPAEGGTGEPYLKPKDLDDPWGNPFVYRYPGDQWTFDLTSLGADNAEGGEGEDADVSNY